MLVGVPGTHFGHSQHTPTATIDPITPLNDPLSYYHTDVPSTYSDPYTGTWWTCLTDNIYDYDYYIVIDPDGTFNASCYYRTNNTFINNSSGVWRKGEYRGNDSLILEYLSPGQSIAHLQKEYLPEYAKYYFKNANGIESSRNYIRISSQGPNVTISPTYEPGPQLTLLDDSKYLQIGEHMESTLILKDRQAISIEVTSDGTGNGVMFLLLDSQNYEKYMQGLIAGANASWNSYVSESVIEKTYTFNSPQYGTYHFIIDNSGYEPGSPIPAGATHVRIRITG